MIAFESNCIFIHGFRQQKPPISQTRNDVNLSSLNHMEIVSIMLTTASALRDPRNYNLMVKKLTHYDNGLLDSYCKLLLQFRPCAARRSGRDSSPSFLLLERNYPAQADLDPTLFSCSKNPKIQVRNKQEPQQFLAEGLRQRRLTNFPMGKPLILIALYTCHRTLSDSRSPLIGR